MRIRTGIFAAILTLFAAASCSTTRSLRVGEYRLARNIIEVDNPSFNSSSLNSYIRQKPNNSIIFDWNPLLSIYNWSGQKDTGLAGFFRNVGQAPVIYDPSLVEDSERNLKTHLEYIGYYGSEVDSRVEVKGKKVYVHYYVTLGRRYTIRSIKYDIPEYGTFRKDFEADRPNVTIRTGTYLSESALEGETERGAQYFRNIGYYGFNKSYYTFEADTLSSDGTAALTMSIKDYTRTESEENAAEHRKYDIGNVTISYPSTVKLRKSALENLNTLVPGQPYSETDVNNTYSRLSQLSVFNSVNIATTPREGDLVDCDIKLRNSGLQGFKTNFEASVNSTGLFGLSPEVTYYHKNFFRGGELLNLGVKGNFQFKPSDTEARSTEMSAQASIRFPRFLGLPNRLFKGARIPHTELSVAFSYQNRPEYTRTIISTSLGYTGNWGSRFFYQFYPFQGNVVRIFDMSADFSKRLKSDRFMLNAYSDHFDLGVGGTLYYTTDASAIPSSTYHYVRLNLDQSGNVLSLFNNLLPVNDAGQRTIWDVPYAQYLRCEIQAGQTIRLGRYGKSAIAFRALAGIGYAYGNSYSMPFEKQFYSGGAGSMRGWQARTLGPGGGKLSDAFIIPSQAGDIKFEANAEYRFPMVWKLEGALFVDAGNIWALSGSDDEEEYLSSKTFPKSVAADWGLGLRLNLDVILVRVDMGLKFRDPSRSYDERWIAPGDWLKAGNYAIHFGVGYPF